MTEESRRSIGRTPLNRERRPSVRKREEQVFVNLFESPSPMRNPRASAMWSRTHSLAWGETGNQNLHPDLAFVSFDRWAAYRRVPKGLPWHVVPDLVVEIVRESEATKPISAWLESYFQSGVNRVWVVYPEQLKVHDHDSPSSSRGDRARSRSTAGRSCRDFGCLWSL